MKVSYIQYDVKHNRDENFSVLEKYLEQAGDGVVVLPELCTCGYLFRDKNELMQSAEAVPGGFSTQKMTALSKQYGCTLIFGVAEADGGEVYNTAVVVNQGKYLGKYRKIHLSDFEKRYFESGTENPVFEIDGVTIGVQICFDLWFPEVSREQIRKGARLLCTLANFGGETTHTISKVRAIENLTPLVLCNRVGNEKLPELDADFLGKSCILDAAGNHVCQAEAGIEAFDSCEIEIPERKSNVICKDFDAEIARHYEQEK